MTPSVILTHTHTLLFVSLLFGEIGFRSALFIVTSRMSYFSNVSFVLCGLCSHSRREAAQAPEGPPGSLLGGTWTRTVPLVTLPNVSIDGRETCWIAVPNKAGAKTKSGLAGWGWGELLLAGELLAL